MMSNDTSFDNLFKDIFVWNNFCNVYIYLCLYFIYCITNIIMWKFIRRLFMILILLAIVFFVYRYINPDGASRLVDKIKAMPDRVSEFIWSEQSDEFNITGTTLVISGDIDILVETGDVETDIDDGKDSDMSWLEELNYEIDKILWKDDEITTWDVIEEDINFDWDEEDVETEAVDVDDTQTWDQQDEPTVIPNPSENDSTENDTSSDSNEWLTDADYQEIEDIFGNLVE